MAAQISGPLHWERVGADGPAMVFVHPNPMDHSAWLYQMAHMSTWFRTVGVDLPGYGRSPTATAGLTMDDLAEACWAAAGEAAPGPAVLVGLSVGARVVNHMAAQRPGATLALVMSGTGYDPTKRFENRIAAYREQGLGYRYEYALSLFGSAFRATETARYLARLFVERNTHADLDTICEMFRALGEPAPDRIFDRLAAPTLIITGSEDVAHPAAFALQRRIPGSELRVMEGAGHCCNVERPWEFDAYLLDFLRRHGIGELASARP